MSKKTFWDGRKNYICPVCKELTTSENYYIIGIEGKTPRQNIRVHKGECAKKARENPELLKPAL